MKGKDSIIHLDRPGVLRAEASIGGFTAKSVIGGFLSCTDKGFKRLGKM